MSGKGIVALLLAALLSACGRAPEEKAIVRPVRVVKAGDVASLAGRWFPGQARATQEVNLSFRVSGPLVEFPVNVGDVVTQGRNIADTRLEVVGETAKRWMEIAQCFTGGPEDPPPPGHRTWG